MKVELFREKRKTTKHNRALVIPIKQSTIIILNWLITNSHSLTNNMQIIFFLKLGQNFFYTAWQ